MKQGKNIGQQHPTLRGFVSDDAVSSRIHEEVKLVAISREKRQSAITEKISKMLISRSKFQSSKMIVSFFDSELRSS